MTLPSGDILEYVYDPFGRRIAKKLNGSVTEKYLRQGMTRLLAIYDGSDNLLMRFEYADGRMPVAMTKGGSTYYLACDQVGSPVAVFDASGNIVKELDRDSFGNVLSDSDPTFTLPFGFAGGLYDPDTDLVRFGHRDYDPDTGRWTAKDPIGFRGGDANLYGYCLSDPVNLVDPDGLRPLNKCEKDTLSPYIPRIDLEFADLHDGEVPWYLPKDMAGITRGNDIYFRPGVYNPSTASGIALLGHELVHVGQYRNGMTWASYLWSVRGGYSEESLYEEPAYTLQRKIHNDLANSGFGGCPCQ